MSCVNGSVHHILLRDLDSETWTQRPGLRDLDKLRVCFRSEHLKSVSFVIKMKVCRQTLNSHV